MKQFIYKYILRMALLLIGALPLLSSCEEETPAGAPVLERVSIVPRDSTTLSGFRGDTYVIFGQNLAGTKEVYFNDFKAQFNPTMVRNDNIIIRVPSNAPYLGATSNKIRVVTAGGIGELDFVVKQLPNIGSFSPAVANAGESVTITGDYYQELLSVKFIDAKTSDTLVAAVDYVSPTFDSVRVIVPEGAKVSYLAVTTSQGTVVSTNTWGFNYVIYTDDLNSTWQNWSWSSEMDHFSTNVVKSGAYSYKHTYTGGWGGLQLSGGDMSLEGFEAVKFSIYGGPGTDEKPLIVNINGVKEYRIKLKAGAWTDYTIPLTELGSPDKITTMVLQDVGNEGIAAPYIMYLDDIGLL